MRILSADGMRKWDAFTMVNEPITSIDLMERAANECSDYILSEFSFTYYTVVCGTGNNGGDGLAIARLLANKGIHIELVIVAYAAYSENFEVNLSRLPQSIHLTELTEADNQYDFGEMNVIDCLFGTGLNRPLTGWVKSVVREINLNKQFLIAIDIPSGLFATDNSKNDPEAIITADTTLTLQSPKMSFFHADYSKFVGDFKIIEIGLSQKFRSNDQAIYVEVADILPRPIEQFAHKGHNGYLMLIAGLENMGGAAVLSAKAAFRTGCGYVGLRSNRINYSKMMEIIPEALFLDKNEIPKKTNAIAIGPGLGISTEARALLKLVLENNSPIVIDADGINLLSKHQIAPPKNAIMTPHLGELRTLIGDWTSPEECLDLQMEYAMKHSVFLLQKGAYSKVCTPEGDLFVNSTGNPGMAKAGMGDALTGIIGSLLAQGYPPSEAAKLGVFLHGMAGDIASEKMGQSLLPSDVIECIPKAYKRINEYHENKPS